MLVRQFSQWLDPALHHAAIGVYLSPANPPIAERWLTKRECQILKLLATGKKNKDIAAALSISSSTVRHHLHNLCRKFDASDRVQLALSAIQLGLDRGGGFFLQQHTLASQPDQVAESDPVRSIGRCSHAA